MAERRPDQPVGGIDNATAANLSVGTIAATGGQVALNINVGNSNTTITFAEYQLFEQSFGGIFRTDG